MPIVFVLGMQGAGKTTVLEKAKGYKGVKIVNMGNLMCEYSIRKGYIKDRDEIRYKIDWRTYQKLYTEAYSAIGRMKGNVIVDTHTSIKAGNKYIPGLPARYVKLLKKIVGFVYIDAPTGEILGRRKADKRRERETDDAGMIDMNRIVDVSVAAYYSSLIGVPLYIISNRNGKIQESVSEFKEAVSVLFGK